MLGHRAYFIALSTFESICRRFRTAVGNRNSNLVSCLSVCPHGTAHQFADILWFLLKFESKLQTFTGTSANSFDMPVEFICSRYSLRYLWGTSYRLRKKCRSKDKNTTNNTLGNFHVCTVHLDRSKFVYQLMHSWIVLKTNLTCTLKLTLKQLQYIYV